MAVNRITNGSNRGRISDNTFDHVVEFAQGLLLTSH